MKEFRPGLPASATGSLLAALTSWVALWSWNGFVETPSGYLGPTLGACLMVAVTGMLLRSAGVPSILVALGQLGVLLLWLNRVWAGDLMYGGWLPTPGSLAEIGARLEAGARVSQMYAAPVPETAPQIFAILIVAGAGTAVLVDFLACGLRRVPLAGLPLLAVYTAPLGILDEGVAWWAFAACALSFLLLLVNDEAGRLSSWGRQLSGGGRIIDSFSTAVDTTTVRASARKIGLTATGLAVVVPIFLPTLGTSLFDGNGTGSGDGGNAVAISNPMVDLRRDLSQGEDVELLRVQTPDVDPSYLRISVLDAFDGDTWKPSGRDIPVAQRAEGRMPRPPGLDPSVPRTLLPYAIQVSSAFESRWLPTPYPMSSIEVAGDWRYDADTLDIVSATEGQTAQDLNYSLEAMRIEPDPEDMAAAAPVSEELFTPYTALPDSVPESVRNLARTVTDPATSRFEKAVLLQEWFREDGGFTYSLDRASGNGLDELEQFLGSGPDSRVGYCEQFAAAMALMGRSIGIPSRVAVGFLQPERIGNDTFSYSAHDQHAWPEMYFEGTGWVRFEPTPQRRASSVPGYTSADLQAAAPSDPAASSAPNLQQNRIDEQRSPTASQNPGDGGSGRGVSGPLAALVGGLLVLLAAGAPRLARTALRRRRWAQAGSPVEMAEAAWGELRDSAIDLGVPWDDTVTLRTRARSLVRSFGAPGARGDVEELLPRSALTGPSANPAATDALERLVGFVERARYAREVKAPEHDVERDVSLCVQALRDGTSRIRRLRASWIPASLAGSLTAGLERRRQSRGAVPRLPEPGVDHAV